jgi:hypothetical protein
MNPYLLAGAAVLVIGVGLGGYNHGKATATERFERVIAQHDADNERERATLMAAARKKEADAALRMAAIDEQHQEDMRNAQIISERTIAGLRDGTVRLRDRLAARQCPGPVVSEASARASGGDAVQEVGLQGADVDFLVRFAAEADQVADQLRACQAVVRADRQ